MVVMVAVLGCKSSASRVATPTPFADVAGGKVCDQRVAVDGHARLSAHSSFVSGGRMVFVLWDLPDERSLSLAVKGVVGSDANEVEAPPGVYYTTSAIKLHDYTGALVTGRVRISGNVECNQLERRAGDGRPYKETSVTLEAPLVVDPLE